MYFSDRLEALCAADHTVWYMNAHIEGHSHKKRNNRNIYQQAMIMFLRQHLVDD